MFNQPFPPSQVRPIRPAMTVSRLAQLGQEVPVTWFSLGAGTSITPEFYDCTTLYLGGEGSGTFVLGSDAHDVPMHPGQLLWVPPGTLCGTCTDNGLIYTEIIIKKENLTMNSFFLDRLHRFEGPDLLRRGQHRQPGPGPHRQHEIRADGL